MTSSASTSSHVLAAVFPEWTTTWSHLGLWLSLWDENGRQVGTGGAGPGFWEALVRHSARFRDRLRDLAQSCRDQTTFVGPLDRNGAILLVAVPLHYRRRSEGTVIACGLARGFFDEEAFARFCDLHRVDRAVFAGIAAGMSTLEARQFEALGRILGHQMQSLYAETPARGEIEDLAMNLAQAYEELNLIYRVSSSMRALIRPVSHLERICHELVSATPIQMMAAILESDGAEAAPTVVRAGPLTVSDEQLLCLYRQIRAEGPGPFQPPAEDQSRAPGETCAGYDGTGAGGLTPLRVVNNAADQDDFAWARGWLRHFAFYDLSRKGRVFGGILVVNRTDDEDLGSYEVQLVNTVADRSAAFLETLWLYDDLEHLFMGMLHALVSSIDAKDPYTCGHSQRVAWLSRHLAHLAGVAEDQCRRVYLSGLLHDIGKIGVSESVLRKTGRLTNQEFDEIKRHPRIGARILEGVPHVEDIIPGVLCHHERMDGRGYPAGLKREEVPFLGRIIGLADSFDAMTTNRTYRRAQLVEVAAAEIRRCSGTQFDPELAEMLLSQDLHDLHNQMTEFGQQPVGSQAGIRSYCSLEARP